MKLAITGKGGTGKTTMASMLSMALSSMEREVLAIDCDPDSNLGLTLGFKDASKIVPVVQMEDLIRERMEVSDDGSFFKLNPRIDDLPEKFWRKKGRIKLIVMGAVNAGGTGCVCPANAFVKNMIEHLVLRRDEDVVMDMEAGVEHFGRGTAHGCDIAVVVIEPSQKSVESARRIGHLAKDIRIRHVLGVANKIRDEKDIGFIKDELKGSVEVVESIEYSDDILRLDKTGDISVVVGGDIMDKVRGLARALLDKSRR